MARTHNCPDCGLPLKTMGYRPDKNSRTNQFYICPNEDAPKYFTFELERLRIVKDDS